MIKVFDKQPKEGYNSDYTKIFLIVIASFIILLATIFITTGINKYISISNGSIQFLTNLPGYDRSFRSAVLLVLLWVVFTVYGVFLSKKKAREFYLSINDTTIDILESPASVLPFEVFKVDSLYGFELIAKEDYIELVILEANIGAKFYYYFVPNKEDVLKKLSAELVERVRYVEGLHNKDTKRKFMKYVGLID